MNTTSWQLIKLPSIEYLLVYPLVMVRHPYNDSLAFNIHDFFNENPILLPILRLAIHLLRRRSESPLPADISTFFNDPSMKFIGRLSPLHILPPNTHVSTRTWHIHRTTTVSALRIIISPGHHKPHLHPHPSHSHSHLYSHHLHLRRPYSRSSSLSSSASLDVA